MRRTVRLASGKYLSQGRSFLDGRAGSMSRLSEVVRRMSMSWHWGTAYAFASDPFESDRNGSQGEGERNQFHYNVLTDATCAIDWDIGLGWLGVPGGRIQVVGHLGCGDAVRGEAGLFG